MLPFIARERVLLRLVLCVLPLLLAGCHKPPMASSPAYAGDYEYGDSGYDGGGGGYEDDYAEADMVYEEEVYDAPAAPAPARSREISVGGRVAKQKGKATFGRDKAARHDEARTTTATTESSGGDEGRIEVEAPEPDETPAPAAQKRQIIYTATMQVSVYDLDHALEIAEALPSRYGGWMHQRIDNQLVLRIPAEHLEAAMATIAELGVVDMRLLEALDVTAEYTDLESRIRVLTEMQKHLQDLLKRATSVEQALEIRKVLDGVTLELEAARAQMRELAKSIAFSTLILRFVERGPTQDVPNHNDPFPWVDQLGVEATDYR